MRLVSWLRDKDGLALILLLLSQAVFLVPKNSTLSGCGSGWDVKQWFVALPGYSLAFLLFFFLSASLPLVPLILLTPATLVSLGVAQCLSILFPLEVWQCSQEII